MKLLAYWPFGIAVIWSGATTTALVRSHPEPGVVALVVVGLVLVVALAAANARWVAQAREREGGFWFSPEALAAMTRHPSRYPGPIQLDAGAPAPSALFAVAPPVNRRGVQPADRG